MTPATSRQAQAGFSLLEVLVAFTVMAMALAVLYHSLGTSVRATAEADRQTRAVLTAESLLAAHDTVPAAGLAEEGTTRDGFGWRVASVPYPVQSDVELPWALHRVEALVRWDDGGRARELRLASLRPVAAERP